MPDDTNHEPGTGPADDVKSEVEKWKALSRKHEERAKENAAAALERDELKKRLDEYESKRKADDEANLSEVEKLTRELNELRTGFEQVQAEREAAELKALRVSVGAAKGLPETLIARLSGTTEAELLADAEALAAVIQPTSVTTGQGALGQPGSSPTDPLTAALASKVGVNL